jgi:hypothetical protein
MSTPTAAAKSPAALEAAVGQRAEQIPGHNSPAAQADAVGKTGSQATESPTTGGPVPTVSVHEQTPGHTSPAAEEAAVGKAGTQAPKSPVNVGLATTASDYEALSRTAEREAILDLDLRVGSKFKIIWRVRQTADTDAGPWETSECQVTDIVEDPDTSTSRFRTQFLWEGVPCEGQLPLQWEFEVASMARIRGAAPSLGSLMKRARPESVQIPLSTAAPSHQVPQVTAYPQHSLGVELAQAQLDAKRGKPTVEVPGGDGLRVPARVPALWSPLYPNFWMGLRDRGGSASNLEVEWRKAESELRTFLGAIFRNPTRRDSYLLAVENCAAATCRPTPTSKLEWRPFYMNTISLMTEYQWVLSGQRASETMRAKLITALQSGFIDFEEVYNKADETEVESETAATTAGSVTMQVLTSALGALQNRVRGRGGFRGGRGNQRGRGRGGPGATM